MMMRSAARSSRRSLLSQLSENGMYTTPARSDGTSIPAFTGMTRSRPNLPRKYRTRAQRSAGPGAEGRHRKLLCLRHPEAVFAKASRSFLLALDRLAENKPDVAITDAATSLQEMFRALGVQGNSVSSQLDAATKSNLIAKADRNLLKPLVDWVNADRSTRGNAHHVRAGEASKADAWLMIHVVGALMVRLSTRETRLV